MRRKLACAQPSGVRVRTTQVPAQEFDISKLTPLDVLILLGPLLAYGVFYAIREQFSVRAHARAARRTRRGERWSG